MNQAKPRRGGLAIHEQMRDDILWLRIEPGSAIDEMSLAQKYGVSRTPVREAVSRLASEGLVHFLPNRTSIVAPLVMRKLKAFFDMYYLLSRAVVREAVIKLAPDVIPALQADVDNLCQIISDSVGEATQKAELKLRQDISSVSDNFFRDNAYRVILDAGIRLKILYLFPECHDPERATLIRNWQDLWSSIQSGDPDAADHAVTRQIRFEADIIERIFIATEGPSMQIAAPEQDH